jgi:cytoskeleton protein RodZ
MLSVNVINPHQIYKLIYYIKKLLKLQKTLSHIGIELRDARIELNLSFSDVSEDIKIQAKFLESIECLDLYELPSIAYVLGYVRSYANFLGIDGNYAVDRFKNESKNVTTRSLQKSKPLHKAKALNKYFLVICFSAIIVLFITLLNSKLSSLTANFGFNGVNSEANYILSQSELESYFPIYWKKNFNEYSNPESIILETIAPTWVEIKNINGKVIFSKVMITSETWKGEAKDIEAISVRDGGALKVKKGFQKSYIIGERGVAIIDYNPFK